MLSVDQHQLVGLGALLNSLRKHTSRGDLLKVYIVVLDMTSAALLSYLTCHHLDTLQVYTGPPYFMPLSELSPL